MLTFFPHPLLRRIADRGVSRPSLRRAPGAHRPAQVLAAQQRAGHRAVRRRPAVGLFHALGAGEIGRRCGRGDPAAMAGLSGEAHQAGRDVDRRGAEGRGRGGCGAVRGCA